MIQEAYIDSDQNTEMERPSYSRLAEFFVLFLWVFLALEGIFGEYVRLAFENHEWWTNLTPWDLFPSELLVYNPLFLFICAILILKGRRCGYQTNRGIYLLVLIMGLGAVGALHGKAAGAPGNYWLADFRQSVLGAFIAPIAVILSSSIRLPVILKRFCNFCVILGLWNGVVGALTFAGTVDERSWMATSWRGEYVLMIGYLVLATKGIITGKTSIFSILCITFGIIVPFHKPTIATFFFGNLFMLALMFLASKRIGPMVYLRSIKMIFISAILATLLVPWIFTLGHGRGREYFETKYLKLQSTADRDLSGRRFEIWRWGFDQWKQNPVFGTGFGFWVITDTQSGERRYTPIHNLLISWLYQLGALGFGIALAVLIIWTTRIWRYFKFCELSDDYWPLLSLFAWVLTMAWTNLYGVAIGAIHIQLLFFMCVGFLSNAESQHWEAMLHGDVSDDRNYEDEN